MEKIIVEIGTGADLHGQDVTVAACRAVRDAISHSCLCVLNPLLEKGDVNEHVLTRVDIAVSRPDDVDREEVMKMLPVGQPEVHVVQGGMKVDGICVKEFGDSDESIEIAVAAVTVFRL